MYQRLPLVKTAKLSAMGKLIIYSVLANEVNVSVPGDCQGQPTASPDALESEPINNTHCYKFTWSRMTSVFHPADKKHNPPLHVRIGKVNAHPLRQK